MASEGGNRVTGREHRLYEIIGAYYGAAGKGLAPERRELLSRHPDLARDLQEFFAEQDRFHLATEPLRDWSHSAISGGDEPPSTLSLGREPGFVTGPDTDGVTVDGTGASDPPPGKSVEQFGDYELLGEIARGGMGVVYKARQRSLNRVVALKMILSGRLASPGDVQRFRNEAEAAARLDHPNIVPIHEVGEYRGQSYFGMKLMEGGSLSERLPDYANNPRSAALLVATIARAVHHAHQRGILHRDLKPSNILLDAEGHPYVSDFGLAKLVEDDHELTQSGAILGTPSYMAPEQASPRKGSVTTATDVYGLGAVLYAMLSNRPPFQGDSATETLERVREHAPEPPSGVNRRVDHDLQTVCLKCLEKDPQRRYESARELAEDLERWLSGLPIEARPTGRLHRAWLWCRRPARVREAGVFSLTLGLVFTVWIGGGLALLALGVIRAERPQQFAFHLIRSVCLAYLPMIWLGWNTLKQRAWALWGGLSLGLLCLTAMLAFLLGDSFDLGGAYNDRDPTLELVVYTLLTTLVVLFCLYYAVALVALCSVRSR